jgi:hypothetical protein
VDTLQHHVHVNPTLFLDSLNCKVNVVEGPKGENLVTINGWDTFQESAGVDFDYSENQITIRPKGSERISRLSELTIIVPTGTSMKVRSCHDVDLDVAGCLSGEMPTNSRLRAKRITSTNLYAIQSQVQIIDGSGELKVRADNGGHVLATGSFSGIVDFHGSKGSHVIVLPTAFRAAPLDQRRDSPKFSQEQVDADVLSLLKRMNDGTWGRTDEDSLLNFRYDLKWNYRLDEIFTVLFNVSNRLSTGASIVDRVGLSKDRVSTSARIQVEDTSCAVVMGSFDTVVVDSTSTGGILIAGKAARIKGHSTNTGRVHALGDIRSRDVQVETRYPSRATCNWEYVGHGPRPPRIRKSHFFL